MPTAQELINSGYIGYTGWGDAEANADFNATGGNGKTGGGGSNGSGGSSDNPGGNDSFSFDWSAADATALAELAPYYEKLLASYKGNIALAKQQMDTDYERGLRVKSEQTATSIEDINKQKVERDRKFKIAIDDLDQTMNSRGLTNSGIKTTETTRSTLDEGYQKGLLDAKQIALGKGLEYFKEESDATRNKQLEKWGMKPVSDSNNPTGQYAPSNIGLNTAGFSVNGYVNEVDQKQAELDKLKAEDVNTKSNNAYNRAFTNWQNQINRVVKST